MAVSAGYTGIAKAATINIAPVVLSASIKVGKKLIDVTALSDTDDKYISGRGNASGSISCNYDTGNAGLTALINAASGGTEIALDLGPATTLHYTFQALISNLSFENDGSGQLKLSFDYTATGAVTKNVT